MTSIVHLTKYLKDRYKISVSEQQKPAEINDLDGISTAQKL